ncbi:MAG TPA: ABC transporter permease [Sphaerochaetaceae bacterium]|nr:ABC transporter permease [Sphaerochaetaceae bacterium]
MKQTDIQTMDPIPSPAHEKRITPDKVKRFLINNLVTILFVILCAVGLRLSGLSMAFYLNDIVSRFARNSFLVLALIIPVMAGMGLNFAIVLGAMAGQGAIIFVTHWGIAGMNGILLSVLICTPIAILLGWMTGRLLNRARGKEMITSLILGFFANGVYQLIFLIMVGSPLIPMKNEVLVLSSGVGLRSTIDLSGGLRYAIDDVIRTPFPQFVMYLSLIGALYLVSVIIRMRSGKVMVQQYSKKRLITLFLLLLAAMIWGLITSLSVSMINSVRVPAFTMIIIAVLCLFNIFIVKTKLGQDFRTVGQDQHIAEVSGINVSRTRVLAIVMSTLLAAWGQIIFLQNLGAFSTYGSHEQVGMFASAAILIGGASVSKATVGHAILGTILFHTLFIVSPLAGRNLFGDAQLGEYFRSFVAYGVIGVALGLHAWKKLIQAKNQKKV